jgi:hypothetical protein
MPIVPDWLNTSAEPVSISLPYATDS